MGTRAELINWRVSREIKKSSMIFELNKSSDSLVTNTAELREIPGKRDKILMRRWVFIYLAFGIVTVLPSYSSVCLPLHYRDYCH